MKKEMLINVLQPEECRIAIVEDGVLEELYVERTSHESFTGNIYKGRVVNLEPAIQAAFVDFSVGRNGFLHVSDVEPQYYNRHDDAPPPPPPSRDRDRDPRRERPGDGRRGDRPDRSERGRRDRSQPRRFGEGLIGDEGTPPPAPLPPSPPRSRSSAEALFASEAPPIPEPVVEAAPPAPVIEETFRGRPEPTSWNEDSLFGSSPIAPTREREIPQPEIESVEPRERSFRERDREREREPEPFDPDLPPSRTHRGRSQTPAVRTPAPTPDPIEEEIGWSRRPSVPLPPEPPPARERERVREREPEPDLDPRRGRGRSRPARPVNEIEPIEPDVFDEPEVDPLGPEIDLEERATPRRGGRNAIRSRGGDREPGVERPRGQDRERPAPAPVDPLESDRPRPPAREKARERPTERDVAARGRARTPEPEAPRDRGKSHDRAGEPGYVPRRERSRAPEAPFGMEPPPSRVEWVDLDADLDIPVEPGAEDLASPSSKFETPRRRRRRRGRRRDRDRPVSELGTNPAIDDELDDEFEDEIEVRPVPPPAAPPSRRAAGRPVAPTPPPAVTRPLEDDFGGDFDFGDEPHVDSYDDDEDDHDLHDDDDHDLHDDVEASPIDDEIDPGLEEEIRREVEEIAELEREMGLRGTTEARPRRGDEPDGGRGGRRPRGRGLVKPPLQEIFRRGDEVLVQVIKESIGTKGPTLSTYISIPGRYLVLMPGLNRVGVSRKIADEGQRRKLREIMNELNPPKGLGFIVRTAGLERTKRELARDLAYLLRLWKVILKRIKKAKAPAPIYQESDMITRTIRDIFTAEIDTIWIDEPAAFERAQEFLRVVMPKFVNRLKLYDEKVPLFHKYGIEDEIAKIQRRHVPLPEGGSIVIDQTEALVAIDVNSGNFRVESDAERTAYEMNLRAAKEIARQLRLRDLGGVIVNDFIDMREERHRRGVEKALRDAIKRDRARTKVLRMSAFGLIEMTRQRIRPSLKRSVYEDCTRCAGAGVVKTVESMSIDVMRILALASHREEIRRVNIGVSMPVATYLNNRKRRDLTQLETESNMTIHIRPEENVPAEHLQIDCFDASNGEIRLLHQPQQTGRRPYAH